MSKNDQLVKYHNGRNDTRVNKTIAEAKHSTMASFRINLETIVGFDE